MIYADFSKVTEQMAKNRGWSARGTLSRGGAKVWANKKRRVIIFPPFVVKPAMMPEGYIDGKALQEAFEKSLRELIDGLEKLKSEGAESGVIVFRGGGSLKIPEEILERLAELGYQILIIGADLSRDEVVFAFDDYLRGDDTAPMREQYR